MRLTRSLSLAALLLPASTSAQGATAQLPAPRTYLYVRGADTIGTERLVVTDTSIEGSLVVAGAARMAWQHVRQGQSFGTLRMQAWAPGSAATAPAAQSAVFIIRGDTAHVEVSGGGAPRHQAVPTRRGATALMNNSVLHTALVGLQAFRASKVAADVFLAGGGQTAVINIARRAEGIALAVGTVEMLIALGTDGLPSQISIPQQGVRLVIATGAVPTPKPPAPVSYDAPAGAPYTAEHVKIPAGSFQLAATLTRPRGAAKVPVVVTISGSGPQDRDARIAPVPGYALFAELADTLARRGIATLRFDDRGVGESGGRETSASATTASFADDVRAIVAWLRARPDVDADRIALLGHSEGGLIAPMVAATDPRVRGIAVLAAPAYSGRDILMFQNRQSVAGMPQYSAAQRDSILRGIPRQLDSVASTLPWMKFFLDYDPRATMAKVKQPVLVLHGDTDRQVTPEQADSLAATLRTSGNTRATLRRFPATNHLFLDDPSGNPLGYGSLRSVKVTKPVLGTIADWMATTLR